MFSKCIEEVISNFGRDIEVTVDGSLQKTGKALIQNLSSKSTFFEKTIKDLGKIDRTNYLYIGPKDIRLDLYEHEGKEVFIKTKNENYVLKKAEKVYLKEEIVYIWAVLSKHIERW